MSEEKSWEEHAESTFDNLIKSIEKMIKRIEIIEDHIIALEKDVKAIKQCKVLVKKGEK